MEMREKELAEREKRLETLISAVKTLVSAMGQRVMTLIALGAGVAAFGWTVFDPTVLRITSAVLYAVLVLLPLAVIDARRE